MGKSYWKPLIKLLEEMEAKKAIATIDLSLLKITDSVTEAIEHIQLNGIKKFGLIRRPSVLLREKGI